MLWKERTFIFEKVEEKRKDLKDLSLKLNGILSVIDRNYKNNKLKRKDPNQILEFPLLAVKIKDEANLIKLKKGKGKRSVSVHANEQLLLFGDMDICVRIAENEPIATQIDVIYGKDSQRLKDLMFS